VSLIASRSPPGGPPPPHGLQSLDGRRDLRVGLIAADLQHRQALVADLLEHRRHGGEGDAQVAREADDLREDVERAAMPAMSAEVRIGREDERIGEAYRGVRISFFK
jgi:hypothetical protein